MPKTIRCAWCGTITRIDRSDRKTCGDACRAALSRQGRGARRRFDQVETRARRRAEPSASSLAGDLLRALETAPRPDGWTAGDSLRFGILLRELARN